MPIAPDTKNWTWVLERACNQCSFDPTDWVAEDVTHAVRTQGDIWTRLLAHPDAARRPVEDQWSALEYGCHVRDVFRIFDHRLERMLTEDAPRFDNWDQDVAAVEDHYGDQVVATVTSELVAAAEAFADRLDTVAGDQWDRTGLRSDGAEFAVRTFALYMIHDPVHHVADVESGYQWMHTP